MSEQQVVTGRPHGRNDDTIAFLQPKQSRCTGRQPCSPPEHADALAQALQQALGARSSVEKYFDPVETTPDFWLFF